MSNDYYQDNFPPPEPNVNQRKWVMIGIVLALFLLLLVSVFVMIDFGHWQGQLQAWWRLTIAEETAQAPAENVKVYTQDDEWVVSYQFDGINELGVPERYENIEEVGNATIEKIEASEGILVDYVVGNPRFASLETNHDPFARFGMWLILGGMMALRLFGRRFRRSKSVISRLVGKSSSAENPDWMQPMSEPGNVEKYQKPSSSSRIRTVLLFGVLLFIQGVVLILFLLN